MAKPLRIEYSGAWYHVMNYGAGKRNIFHTDVDYNLFLQTLQEIHLRHHMRNTELEEDAILQADINKLTKMILVP